METGLSGWPQLVVFRQVHQPVPLFKTSPEIIRLAVMLYIRFPLSLRDVEDLLHEGGIVSPRSQRVQGHTDLERIVPRTVLDRDPAQFGELVDRRLAAEPPIARRLDAAKRHLRLVMNRGPVNVANAAFDARGHPHGAAYIAAEHRRR